MHLTQTLHQALQQEPDRTISVYGQRRRTVAECADRVSRFAGALRELGVASGDRVGILALNSDRYHEYFLAVPWADTVLNPINIRWSAVEIVFALRESQTRVLLVDDQFAPMVPALREGYPELSTVIFIGDAEELPEGMLDYEQLLAAADPVDDVRRGGDQLLGLYYTGGTTGTPKGVMLSHRNLLTSAMGSLATGHFLSHGGRLLHSAPMFHLADGASWMAGQLAGTTHVMVPMFTPDGVLRAIADNEVTDALLVPTMIQLLVDHPDTTSYDLSGVRHVTYGASAISEAVLERAGKTFPNADFMQAYGMTELSPVATLLQPADHQDPMLRRSAGRAAPHGEVQIVDAEDNEVPRGTVGEVVARGDHVMLGYWNRPEETEAALRGGWMHTGDGGYMDDRGYVFIVDRLKDMIVSGGENVYSAEVENALAKHPGVASVAVIGVPDQRWGERVHAVVVPQQSERPTAEELREHCRTHIAGYKLPATVELVDELPMSGAGKILKRELREQYWADADRQVR